MPLKHCIYYKTFQFKQQRIYFFALRNEKLKPLKTFYIRPNFFLLYSIYFFRLLLKRRR